MPFEIEIRKLAEKDLKKIPIGEAQKITRAISRLEKGLVGDLKKLTNHHPDYRLRVGDWRVLLEIRDKKIIIYRIHSRKEAYR